MPTNHKPPPGCAGWRPLFHFNTASRAGSKKQQFPPCHLPVPRDALALLRARTIETLHGWWGKRSPILLRHASYCSSRIAASVLVLCASPSMSPVLGILSVKLSATPFLSLGKQSGKTRQRFLHMSFSSVLSINVNVPTKHSGKTALPRQQTASAASRTITVVHLSSILPLIVDTDPRGWPL